MARNHRWTLIQCTQPIHQYVVQSVTQTIRAMRRQTDAGLCERLDRNLELGVEAGGGERGDGHS